MAKVKKLSPDIRSQAFTRGLAWLLLVGGLVGIVASLILTVERIEALKNPAANAVCDLNPIFSCSSVSSSAQAEVFGIPNPLIGLVGYTVVATVGVVLLSGGKLRRWFWQSIQIGLLLATAFIHWLIFETLYRIGALCLFCMVVWAVTIPMFWYTTLYNLKEGNLRTPPQLRAAVDFAIRHHGDILLAWFVLIIALIIKRFWYYWSTLF